MRCIWYARNQKIISDFTITHSIFITSWALIGREKNGSRLDLESRMQKRKKLCLTECSAIKPQTQPPEKTELPTILSTKCCFSNSWNLKLGNLRVCRSRYRYAADGWMLFDYLIIENKVYNETSNIIISNHMNDVMKMNPTAMPSDWQYYRLSNYD